MTNKEVLKELKSSLNGLSEHEAEKRLKKYGLNEFKHKKKLSAIKIFLYQFENVMVFLLLFAAFVSFAIGETLDSIVILVILFFNVVLGFLQEYKADKAMEALLKLATPKAIVIRDGKQKEIDSKYLVVGDIVVLNTGDKAPANIRVLESFGLKVNQAHLTGESIDVVKTDKPIKESTPFADRSNIIYMGSTISSGKGIGVVIATGSNTEVGQIAENVQREYRKITPIQKEINNLGKFLAAIVVILVAILFVLGILFNHSFVEMLLTSVSLAVSVVPEGLPAVITVTLAIGMRRMAKRNAIVRKLSAVQTLGDVTVICSDKTGTLTKNEMTVTKIFDCKDVIDVSGVGYSSKGEFSLNGREIAPSHLRLLFECGVLCNNAYYSNNSILGDPTEGSLLVLSEKAGHRISEIKSKYKELAEISFNSVRKMMSVVVEKRGKQYIFSKGATSVILDKCNRYYYKGKVLRLGKRQKEKIEAMNNEFASNALRVLALAYKPLDKNYSDFGEEFESDLIFLGLVGMIDPPREDVKDAISMCKRAGIRVMMLTGDHALTARAVAKQIGLIEDDEVVLTNSDLNSMDDNTLLEKLDEVNIFARVSPKNKLRIVNLLKRKGEIVATTGDGVNDAPALKSSDIGIAMGITGTDITKEASDMILADDNFSTIVYAIKEGRNIYNNIKKFVRFLLTSNADTLFVIATMIVLGLPIPYIPIHILWMNLITDGFPALALTVDPNLSDVMNKKPRDPNSKLLKEVISFVVIGGLIDALTSIFVFIFSLNYENFFNTLSQIPLAKARTIVISKAIFYELFLVFNCRDDKKSVFDMGFKKAFLSNKWLTLSVLFSIVLQLLFIYNPVFNTLFKTVPLTLNELLIVVAFSSIALFLPVKLLNRDLNKV